MVCLLTQVCQGCHTHASLTDASMQEAPATHHSLNILKLLVKTTWQTNSAERIPKILSPSATQELTFHLSGLAMKQTTS